MTFPHGIVEPHVQPLGYNSMIFKEIKFLWSTLVISDQFLLSSIDLNNSDFLSSYLQKLPGQSKSIQKAEYKEL